MGDEVNDAKEIIRQSLTPRLRTAGHLPSGQKLSLLLTLLVQHARSEARYAGGEAGGAYM